MASTVNSVVVQLLQGWIADGVLASQHSIYINTIRNGKDTFYGQRLKQDGIDAAEQELREWANRNRGRAFATCLESAAMGMLALARVDNDSEYVQIADVSANTSFPRCTASGASQMVVAFNPQLPGCGWRPPVGATALAPNGRLGLKALTLEVGTNYYGNTVAQLGVVLPLRSMAERTEGYAVVTIDPEGRTGGVVYELSLDVDAHFRSVIGLGKSGKAVTYNRIVGGQPEDVARFPGATAYLADTLPGIDPYYTALADHLGANH